MRVTRKGVCVDPRPLSRFLSPAVLGRMVTTAEPLVCNHGEGAVQNAVIVSKTKTLRTAFRGFDYLPRDKLFGPAAELHGVRWKIFIFPSGETAEDENHLSFFLERDVFSNTKEMKADITLRLVNHHQTIGGGEHVSQTAKSCVFGVKDEARNIHPVWGFRRIINRDIILDKSKGWLNDGSILVEADIRIYTEEHQPSWRPPSRLAHDFLRMLATAEEADCAFIVGGERVLAHRFVLRARSPALAALCDESGADVEIGEVTAAVFREVVRFAYSDALSSSDAFATAEGTRVLLRAADRFGLVRLKQLAEIELATRHVSIESAADALLFAASHCCPQLKESATKLLVEHTNEAMATEGWSRLAEQSAILYALMKEICEAKRPAPVGDGDDSCADERDRVKRLRVSDLRQKLAENGLETDGMRADLEARVLEAIT